MNPTQLRNRLIALNGASLAQDEVYELLRDITMHGGGVSLELDDTRFRLVWRDGHFGLKKVERPRNSSLPPGR